MEYTRTHNYRLYPPLTHPTVRYTFPHLKDLSLSHSLSFTPPPPSLSPERTNFLLALFYAAPYTNPRATPQTAVFVQTHVGWLSDFRIIRAEVWGEQGLRIAWVYTYIHLYVFTDEQEIFRLIK